MFNEVKMKQVSKQKIGLYQKYFKRAFDVCVALLVLIILSPVMIIVSIISMFSIGCPIIFSQYRPGKNGKVFKFYKFRSMSNKKDKNGNLLPDSERLTKFGRFLRKTNLDELPQIFNIIKGDMSFVGPRPRLVKDMVFYDENVMTAYSVKPGITCLSQISGGRSESSWEDIFKKDLEYSQNITFFGDIKILFKTLFVLFKKEGKGSNADESTREYYYPDYLLKSGKITKDQYNKGLESANNIINSKGQVVYTKKLHKTQTKTKQKV